MSMRRRRIASATAGLALVAALGACSEDEPASGDPDRVVLSPPSEGADHTHAPGQEHGADGPVGDGTTPAAGGYRMTDVRLPSRDGPGEVAFRIVDEAGAPLTEYVEEQTKLLHLYVVRADLSAFRHLHPELDDDGTWRTRADLGSPGTWRVVAEFTPAGAERQVLLGSSVRVPGRGETVAVPRGEGADVGDDGVVRVRVAGDAAPGGDGRLQLVVSTLDDEPLPLGSYLGAAAHLTGFALEGGQVVHLHPYGAPEQSEDGTVLTFHTTFTEPGDYRLFLQVRVEGLLHTVPVTVSVS